MVGLVRRPAQDRPPATCGRVLQGVLELGGQAQSIGAGCDQRGKREAGQQRLGEGPRIDQAVRDVASERIDLERIVGGQVRLASSVAKPLAREASVKSMVR